MDGDQVPLLAPHSVAATAGGGATTTSGSGGSVLTIDPVPPPSHQVHFFPAAPMIQVTGAGVATPSTVVLHQHHHSQQQLGFHPSAGRSAATTIPGTQFFQTTTPPSNVGVVPPSPASSSSSSSSSYDDYLSGSPIPLPPSSSGDFEMRQLGIADSMSGNLIISGLAKSDSDDGDLELASSLDTDLLSSNSTASLLGVAGRHRRCASTGTIPSNGAVENGSPVMRLSSDGSQTMVLVSALRTSGSARKKLRVSWIDDLGKPLHEVATVPRSWDRTPVLSEVMQRKFARARQERQRFVAICCGIFICLFVTAIGIVTVLLRIFLS